MNLTDEELNNIKLAEAEVEKYDRYLREHQDRMETLLKSVCVRAMKECKTFEEMKQIAHSLPKCFERSELLAMAFRLRDSEQTETDKG